VSRDDAEARHSPLISSLQNQWVKRARSLHRRNARSTERAFLVEGVRAVRDALESRAVPTSVFFDPDLRDETLRPWLDQAAGAGARVMPVTAQVLRTIADTETPQGIVAVFPFPSVEPQVQQGDAPLVVVADGLRDPGNLGTLIRSALGAGCHALFVTHETTDPFAPKVVRAGMGAHFRLPILRLDWERPHPLVTACTQRLGAAAGVSQSYDTVDLRAATCLVIGGEATGLSDGSARAVNGFVGIPLAGGLESLNAGVAGSVILFEAARQRRGHLARNRDEQDSVHTRQTP